MNSKHFVALYDWLVFGSPGSPQAWLEFEKEHALGERFELASLHLCTVLHKVCTSESSTSPPSTTFFNTLTSLLRLDAGGQGLLEGLVVRRLAMTMSCLIDVIGR